MAGMDIYDRLGIRKRINAAGLLTRLGGSLIAREVLEAMREAAQSFVDIAELQAKASVVIAQHTGAEAGLLTSGAAAALTLGTAACLTGLDVTRMERLPDTEGMPDEVLMCRTHRTAYDHAIRPAGARIREVGFNDRIVRAEVCGVGEGQRRHEADPRQEDILRGVPEEFRIECSAPSECAQGAQAREAGH